MRVVLVTLADADIWLCAYTWFRYWFIGGTTSLPHLSYPGVTGSIRSEVSVRQLYDFVQQSHTMMLLTENPTINFEIIYAITKDSCKSKAIFELNNSYNTYSTIISSMWSLGLSMLQPSWGTVRCQNSIWWRHPCLASMTTSRLTSLSSI